MSDPRISFEILLPRLIQGILLGSVIYWVLLRLFSFVATSSDTNSLPLIVLSAPILIAGGLLARLPDYRGLGIGFMVAVFGSVIYNLVTA